MYACKKLWLDCDPGLDDTLAITLAALSPQLKLLGISTSAGNTSLQNTTRNALDILYNCGCSNIPVYMGSEKLIKGAPCFAEHMHGSNGLGGVTIPKSDRKVAQGNFLQGIRNQLMNEDKVVWANTGSLTNLCLLLQKFPDVRKHIDKIVMMGGAIGQGNITPAAQFNIYFDPHAFSGVLKSKDEIELVMIPLEAKSCVFTRLKQLQHIPFLRAIHQMLLQYQKMYQQAYSVDFPYVHDPAVVWYILNEHKFTTKNAIIQVDLYQTSYGRTNCYFQSGLNFPKKSYDKVATNIADVDQLWEKMFVVFGSIAMPK